MGIAGILFALPALAAPSKQAIESDAPVSTAMHQACEAGDVEGMKEDMAALAGVDLQVMQEQMGEQHYGAMGSHMSGGGQTSMMSQMGSQMMGTGSGW